MSFKARIYKVGINACVEVPSALTSKMKSMKGFIHVTGKINGHAFKQTLVPVRNSSYRLYVNIPMLKGGKAKVGDTATFTLKQATRVVKDYKMHPLLLKALKSNNLTSAFDALTQSRQKDILKYLGSLKAEETVMKNVNRVVAQLKKAHPVVRIP